MFHGLSHQQVVLALDPRTCLVRNKDYRVRLQVCEMERNHYRKQLGLQTALGSSAGDLS